MAHLDQHGDGAQAAQDAADAHGVGDGLAQAVFLRDFKIDNRAGFVARDLNHADGVVRAVERALAVEAGFNRRVNAERFGDAVGDDLRGAQTFVVDVVQTDGAVGEFGEAQNVAHEIFGEDGAARADKRDFYHSQTLQRLEQTN